MLYYIVPPIIIIVSVSILIFFLFRKAQQIHPREFISKNEEQPHAKRRNAVASTIGQFGLKVLERIVHRSKLMSLRFHNASNDLFHSIREKRQRKMLQMSQETGGGALSGNVGNSEVVGSTQGEKVGARQTSRPMVRDTYARPQSRQQKPLSKEQLENALIKRIAVNPRDIEAYERLGDYYMESENWRDALECFRQVLKLSPVHQKAKMRIRRIERMTP